MADLKTQFGFTDSLFEAINEVKKASGTSVADSDAQIKRAKANLDAAELNARQQKEREKVQKKKESLRTEEAEIEEEKFDALKHVKKPSPAVKTAAKDVKRGSYADRAALMKAGGVKDDRGPRGVTQEETEIEESFSPSQIAALKKEYSTINGIDPSSDNYKKLIAMLDKLDLASLKSLAGAEIKFVSGLAKNRVMRKSVKKEEVESIDELSAKQKAMDKNKNGKIDGSDLAKLRNKSVSESDAAYGDSLRAKEEKRKMSGISGADKSKLSAIVAMLNKEKKKHPQGADFAAQRRKERMASNGRMDEEVEHKDGLNEEYYVQRSRDGNIHVGSSKNGIDVPVYKIQPEHSKKIKSLTHGGEYNFTDAANKKVVAKRSNNTVTLSSPDKKRLMSAPHNFFKEEAELEEGAGNLKPGWMLKKDPELAKKVKEKQDLAKKRQASYGDKSAGKSVAEGIIDKIKAAKRGMDARAKAADHFDRAGDPNNADKKKDLKRAVKYHNLVNKEEVESDEVGIVEALETSKVPVGSRPKGIGWSLHRAGKQHNEPHDTYKRTTKQVASSSSKNEEVEEEVKDEYGRKVDKYLKKKYGSDDSKKKQPQGAEFAAARRKERMDKNGRMDEEVKVGDKVSFDHPMSAIPGKTMKKVGTIKKIVGDTAHLKSSTKYGTLSYEKKVSELRKEEVEVVQEAAVTKQAVIDYLVKGGFNKADVSKDVEKLFAQAVKSYPTGNTKKIADVISSLRVNESLELDEGKYDNKYTIYHKDYSSAVQHAAVHAGKQGYEIDHDDWDRVVAMGPKKPSSGKTNILSVSLKKDGKESKKKLHMQVYNMDNKGYELNTYVEEVQLDELNKDTVYSYAKKSEKDQDDQEDKMNKAVKANDPKKANDAGRKFLNRLKGSERAEKRLNAEEAAGYDEFKSGGKPLEKKFNKAFKAMGIKSDIKIKTVGNVSVNEAVKPTKKFKDMKKKNVAGTKSEEGASKKGEPLSGKKEAIEVNPELHKNQK
jgi:hypothetical protein